MNTDPTDESRIIYETQLKISGQPVNVLVDTGSSWTVVKSCSHTFCPAEYFDPMKSKSLKCTPYKHHIKYGTAEVNGLWCSDQVETNGLSAVMPILLDEESKLPLGDQI